MVLHRWGEEHDAAVAALKAALLTSPVLLRPQQNLPFMLVTDASDFAAGAGLEQADESSHCLWTQAYMVLHLAACVPEILS